MLAGAVTGFGLVAALALGGLNVVLAAEPSRAVRAWGGLHLPSVGSSIGLVYGLTELVHGWYMWPLVGCTATTTYLFILAAQFHLATRRRAPEPEPALVGNVSSQR